MSSQVDLSGTWRAVAADESQVRNYHDPDFDDGTWPIATVPGHWRSDPALAGAEGSVLYRTAFDTPSDFGPGHDEGEDLAGTPRRTWLVFDGIFYTSDVWLDGAYLGDTEGYFFPHEFEISEHLGARSEHALALEVACPRPSDLSAKRNLTGVFQHWDLLDQEWNPGGIWRPVRLEQSGIVRIKHWRLLCREATDQAATLLVRVVVDTAEAQTVELVTTIVARPSDGDEGPAASSPLDQHEHRRSQSLAAGENRVEWTVTVPQPRRWWPHALGDQPLYDVEVEVRTESGSVSDRRTRRIGLRTVEMRDWITHINGERLFLKGANQGPTRMALAEATPGEMARDVTLAVDAGLDFLRLHAHIARPELYEAADEAGLLLWQDLPLQWGYSRSVRGQARRQARLAVDHFGHHPSVFLWCGHNEPVALEFDPESVTDPRPGRGHMAREFVTQTIPTWNRTLLDRAIKSVLERNDNTRPVIAHSGVFPHPPQLDGTDSHLYLGWYTGDERDLAALLGRWPRLARFVSEFGAQAVPETDDFIHPERWPELDWDELARRHGLQRAMFDRYVPPTEFERYEDWKEESQIYQSRVLRYQIETLRRLKYRPTGGFAQFCFADSSPAVTCSVLDDQRVPKPGYEALRAACQPVIVVADRPPDHVHPGDHVTLAVHVVSDARIAYSDIVVRAHLSWEQEVRRDWSWQGDIPADDCVLVGTLAFDVPVTDDALVIDLELKGDGLATASRYGTWVISH